MKVKAFPFLLVAAAVIIPLAVFWDGRKKEPEMIYAVIDPNTGVVSITNGSRSLSITSLAWKVVWKTNSMRGEVTLRTIQNQKTD